MAVELEKRSFMERAPDIYFYSTMAVHLLKLVWSLAALAVGSAMANECPAEEKIPISLIVLSAAMFTDAMLFLLRNRIHRNHTYRTVQVHNVATAAGTLFEVLFLVATMTFLAITEADHADLGAGNYCNLALYKFAFSTCIFTMLVLFFFKRNPFPCRIRGRVRLDSRRESREESGPGPGPTQDGGIFP